MGTYGIRHFFVPLLFFCLLSGFSESKAQTGRPNIVIIFADDLGYADVGSFGAKNIATPHIDRLAAEGMRFTDFYAMPSCSPSRAAILTGCYPQRVGMPVVVGPKGPEWIGNLHTIGLNPAEETLPELLKGKGYRTACIGKWHLGHLPEHLPTRHGFDEFYGLPYSNDMWPANDAQWPDLPLMQGEKTVSLNPDQSQLTQNFTRKALSFIEKNRREPFFLYLAHSMPHVPLYASDRFRGKSKAGLYGDVVEEIDWSVGEVLRALDRLKLASNTLVIFTSDNGPWRLYGNHAGSSGPFREGKATTFEGGVRVPFIARFPGMIKPGTVSGEPTGLMDLLPTLVQLVGAKSPSQYIDGKSMLPLLKGEPGVKASREAHYYFQGEQLQAIRQGKWKLHLPHRAQVVAEPGKDGKQGKYTNLDTGWLLYDLEADPGETTDRAEQHPEKVTALKELAAAFAAEMERNKRKPAIAQ
jgi:arylsulfatase